jgi:hypothetical protein
LEFPAQPRKDEKMPETNERRVLKHIDWPKHREMSNLSDKEESYRNMPSFFHERI